MINVSKLYCGLAGESDDLRYSQEKSFGPVVVYNCTSRCNLRCRHCYSFSEGGGFGDELSTAEAKKLLLELCEANCPVVLFSGGEPLLREDLFELLAEAKRLKLRTVISTNATLIDMAAAERLAESGVGYVGISIDGGEPVHDEFRAVEGSFKAAIEGIENCKRSGLRVGLRFTITGANRAQIPIVFDIAAQMEVRRICFYHLIRTGRARGFGNQGLSPEQTRSSIDAIIDVTDDFVRSCLVDEVLTVGNHADGPYILVRMLREEREGFDRAGELLRINGGNGTGEKIGCVSWDGNVYPDQFWRNYSVGNVKDKSFKGIWENTAEPVLNKLRNKSEFADSRCLGCRWFGLCKGNYRFLEGGGETANWLNEPACYLTDEEISKGA